MAEQLLYKNLRPASFRGVEFKVTDTDLQAGRRVQVNEYPQRDKPYMQDMGRGTRQIGFTAFVVGADYIDKANALLTALEAYGSGTLMHPFWGRMHVNVLNLASVHFDNELGVATFQLSFVEAGELTFPQSAPNTAKTVKQNTSNLLTKAKNLFNAVYRVSGFINQVLTRALNVYNTALHIVHNPLGFAMSQFGIGGFNLLGSITAIGAAINNPLNLSNTYTSLLSVAPQAASGTLTASAITPAQNDKLLAPLIAGLISMAQHPCLADPLGMSSAQSPAIANPNTLGLSNSLQNIGLQLQYIDKATAYQNANDLTLSIGGYLPIPAMPTDTIITPSQQQQFINTTIINLHTRLLLLANACGLSSMLNCAVYDDIIALRDKLTDALENEILSLAASTAILDIATTALLAEGLPITYAPIAQWQSLSQALVDLRNAVWLDLTERSQNAARLRTIQLQATMPALAIAYDIYEDPTRETEITERNKAIRPGFIPAGSLQVLST